MHNYLIIPDLHGQYYTFLNMLKKFVNIVDDVIQPSKYKIILLGDLIDKGDSREQILLIDFIYNNLDKITILLGNHEYKTRKKIIKGDDFNLSNHYDFYKVLLNNNSVMEKFISINEAQIKYFEDDVILCTHSPCLLEHVEKKNGYMVQYPYNRIKEGESITQYNEYLKSFFSEIILDNQYPKFHFVGHLGLEKPLVNNSQIWLDTKEINKIVFATVINYEVNFYSSDGSVDNYYRPNSSEDCLRFVMESLGG